MYRIILMLSLGLCLMACHDTDESVVIKTESPDGRDGYRSMMRDHSADSEKIEKAKNLITSQILKSNRDKDAGLSNWEELGPGQYAGRTRAIAVHPNDPSILWVGGVSGGLWKSTNTGNSWVPKGLAIANFSITSILIHPTQPDTMYVSTGEGITAFGANAVTDDNPYQSTPGGGIFRSFDGGDSWERVPGISDVQVVQFLWVNKIMFDPNDASQFYAVTSSKNTSGIGSLGNIHKFENNGESWTFLSSFSLGNAIDIEIDPLETSKIYIGYEEGYVKGSISGGSLVFTSQLGIGGFPAVSGRVEIAIDPTDNTIIYALCEGDTTNYGLLYKSINGGLSWTDMNLTVEPFKNGSGQNQGWYNNTIWVDPLDPELVIIGGIKIWRSLDGGATFTAISSPIDYYNGTSAHADCHIAVASSGFSAGSRVVYFGTDGGIVRAANISNVSETSGWQIKNGTTLNTTQFYAFDVAGTSNNTILIGGTQDNGTLMSSQDVADWEHVLFGDGGFCAISRQDTSYRYATQQQGVIYNYNALGLWFPFDSLINSPNFICPIAIFPNDGSKFLAGDQGLTLYQSDPFIVGPVNTKDVTPIVTRINVNISAIDIVPDGSKVVVGYTNGEVWVGTPGVTWDWGAEPVLELFRPITSVAFHILDDDKIAVASGGYYDNNVWITQDNGVSWTEMSSGIPELHINKLLWHYEKPNWIYAGTDLGVYASEDNGQNWNVTPHFSLNDGPIFSEISDMKWGPAIQALDGPHLYIATFGRGIWKTLAGARSDIYFESLHPAQNVGTMVDPYRTIKDGAETQAHGQTWHIVPGDYKNNESGSNVPVILDKRLGELLNTSTGSIIIGDN